MTPRLWVIAVLYFSFLACKEEAKPPAENYDVEADFRNIPIDQSGIQDVVLKVGPGVNWQLRVIIPEHDSNEKHPLLLALHGGSGYNPEAHTNTDCYVEPGLSSLGAFILHPNSGLDEWPDIENQQKLAGLTLLALKYWPVDSAKVAVTGYSNGGNASWLYGESQPQIFSAAIPMASSYNTLKEDSSARLMPIPMYVIHGENDELFPLAQTQAWVEASQQAGSDIKFVVAPGLGHYEPCEYMPYLQNAARWLKDSVWQ